MVEAQADLWAPGKQVLPSCSIPHFYTPQLSPYTDPGPGVQMGLSEMDPLNNPHLMFLSYENADHICKETGQVAKSGESAWPGQISYDLSRKCKLLLKPRAKGEAEGWAEPQDAG